mmetsp:Transcript_29674/g.63034  ORF Transcript_29674/g.63034 Transcript_29674/m.63034 type:complete len:362 (-) Transcript_29674:278-1363(-)|eukprot:CAMPEP_0172526170 /NCGR_PEP_ID=MMETSP1067-20121228/1138_1 /TAXON_ID=265564 ORGANISM="Thalassiosira punctigera, Strain Tpunct2005C2" /NCGR_SAMPLE_ID=MMETSP1067 /ASSEMBLY_ACC=CAM_ASM_000444 /LENGTH=361 /DNA_ID=CAMNT_0013309617 /DNA_START=222 /DNA_END=1307 /DNA_ORIENTATION=-
MGLRPSVKKNESNDTHEFSHDEGNRNSLPASPPALPPQREAWTARGQLLLNFHHAISRAINSSEMLRKCSQIAEDMSRSEQENTSPRLSPINEDAISVGSRQNCAVAEMKSHSMAEEYGAEAALIVENKSKRDAAVRNKSLALGIFSFAALRGGRGLGSWARRWIGNLRAGRSYQFESHLRPGTFMKNSNNAESAVVESEQPSKLRRFLRVAFDATISTSIAFLSGAFLFMPRPSAYIEDMAKLPLVQGKSVYAEMVCPPLLREYRRVLEQYGGRWPVQDISSSASGTMDSRARGDDAEPQLTQEDVSLNVIRTFVENCSKRSKYEVSGQIFERQPGVPLWILTKSTITSMTSAACIARGT